MSCSCEQVFEMSSLEKRQANRRGSTHGPRKCSDGISDTSSVGGFMDDTDREVSSLTERAFRSLCIGEDAIYNDLEVSSPADQHTTCAQEALQKKDLTITCQEFSSHGIQYEGAERKSEVASTFQHSYVDVAQEHVLRDESLSYISNGSMEATWQQKRSTSRVSSLIKAFSSGESYCDSGTPDTVKDKYRDFNNESWDKSALLSIQKELSGSGYCSDFRSGPLQSYGNHFHSGGQMNTATSSKTKFKVLNTTNLFFHSEFSPFQLWRDYNRFPFERGEPSGFVPVTEFPRWYESPLYKESTAMHRISSSPAEGRQFNRRQIEDISGAQRSKSTVIQKASAVEKRCESEIASNNPPWKNNNFAKNKLPSNRPSTASPTKDKLHRPDSSLLYQSRHTYETHHKVGKAGSSELPSRTTPFNISQLLTPVIPGRQETETSEILQFAHTPLMSECDSDLKPQSDAKQLRDSYKSKASSLLFNLKDNRKRVKSTYSPTKFKGLELSDRSKQPSKLEGRESRLSESSGLKAANQEFSTAADAWELSNSNYELSLSQTAEHKQYVDKSHNNMTLFPQYGTTNCNIPYLGSQNNHPDLLNNRESEHFEVKTNSGHGNNGRSPVKEDAHYQNFKEGRNFVSKPTSGYINNQMTEENLPWKRAGPVNMVTREIGNNNGINDALPYKGEIAALIEMDKQRKATAKQYLPSVNESSAMRKEMCINKVNENVNGSWLPRDKQIQDTRSSLQTYTNKCLQKMSSPTKETNFTFGSEITTHDKAEVHLHGNMKYAANDIETEKDYSQRTQFLQSMEEKYKYNEGSVAYQPYKYESNKQWHIVTENRHTKSEECMSRQLQQTETKAEQPNASNYVHSLSRISGIQQQSTAYPARTSQRNLIIVERAKTEEHKPTYSIAPSQTYHVEGDINTHLHIPNTQRTFQNTNRSQTRGEKFNINDILSVRDNEQVKKSRENRHSFNGRVGEPTKLENLTSLVTSDVAENIAAKSEPSKVLSQAQQDGNSHCNHENTNVSYSFPRKQSHVSNDVKEKSGKDMLISNEKDKTTPRALSYKEKGQTKQEILTSKLKAHAQKEISAIKGLAKHSIPSRTPIKQTISVSNETGQINQEVRSPRKEITAEKLNHLFQDITYSSVPLYKEQKFQDANEPKTESLEAEKVDLPTRNMGFEKDKVANEKERSKMQMIKSQEERFTEEDKKNVVQKYAHQLNMKSKENQFSNPSEDNLTEPGTTNGKIVAKSFSSSPSLKVFTDEESAVNKINRTSPNLSTTYTSNNTDYSTFKVNGNDIPNHEVLGKAATNHLTLCNIAGEAVTLERSVNKLKEQLSNVNTDKSTANSNTPSQKGNDFNERSQFKDNTIRENPLMPPNARQFEIGTGQDKTSSDIWMKDEDEPVTEVTVEFTDSKTTLPNKQMANTEQQSEQSEPGAGGISKNQTVFSENPTNSSNQVCHTPNTEPPEKEKQEIQTTNEDVFLHKPQNTHDDMLKSLENAHAIKKLGCQTTLSLSKVVNMELDSSEENKCSLEHEHKVKMLHCENSEGKETVSQFQIKNEHENQNQAIMKDKEVTKNINQQLEANNEAASDTEQHKQNATDFHEHAEITPMEREQSDHDIRTCNSGSKSSGTEHEKSDGKLFMPIVTINNKDEQLSGHPAPDKSADIKNSVPESHIIHIASKTDSSPTDEPVIYNICVSSTSEPVSEDEPIIFSISVSSLCDAAMVTSPEDREKSQNQLSKEHKEKDEKETISDKNKEHDFVENKEDSKEVKLLLNNHMAEQETVERKNDSPASKDKLDYNRSTEVDNISSSYESLLAKKGLPNGDTILLESDPKEQDKKRADEKDECTGNSLQKLLNNTMDNEHPSTGKMLTLAEFIKKHSPECRKPKSPETFPELLKNVAENHMQHVTVSEQEHQIADGGGTQRADGVLCSDKNIEKDVSEKQEMMSKIVSVCEDTENTQPTRKIMANGNVQLEENKQVGQKVQTVEKGLEESDDDDVVNKNTKMVQITSENDAQLPAEISSPNSSYKSLNHSCDESPKPSAKISTKGCQIKIKTQDTGVSSVQTSQNAVNQTDNAKSPTLQHRTQVCERGALNQEKVSKEHLQTRNNKDLQNIRNELVCKSELPEIEKVRFMTSNEVKISANRASVSQKEISNVTNEQTKENFTVNQTQIKYDLSSGKTDQSVFAVPDITLKDKEVHTNERENQIKAESASTGYVVPPNNVSESPQNTTPAKVTGTKASSALVTTESDLDRTANGKWKREPTQKAKEIIKEIIPLNNDFKTASSVKKADKDVKCSKSDTNQKAVKTQPQYKIDGHIEKVIDTEKSSGHKVIKSGIGILKESNDITRYDIESSRKVLEDKRYQINSVYLPHKGALVERKGNMYDGKNRLESNQNSNHHDTGLSKKEGTITKTAVTPKEKKTTRPEISALADYARLRVISAEDDTITEKDLLQKMNMNLKYNLSAVEPQKANFSMSVGGTEQSKQLSVNKTPENSNSTTTPLQVQERRTYKITEETLAGQYQCSPRGEIITYPKVGSLTKSLDDRGFIINNPESAKEKTLTNPLLKNTKKSLTAHDYGYSSSHEVYQPQNPQATHPVQTQLEDKNDPKLKQPVNANMSERKVYTQVKKSQSVTQVSIETEFNNANRPADHHIKEDVKDEETTEELQYYIVNAMESEKKTKNSLEPLSLSQQKALKKELTEMHVTSPRSNTSSPAMGKPILFRVKDNTGKTSSVTKTVRPRFHRSLSEEYRIGSPVDSCSEKIKVDYGHENDPKESPNSQFFQEQSVTSHQLPRTNEIQVRSKILSPEFIAPKEPGSYNRRSHLTENDESQSLVSTVSENVGDLAATSVVMTNSRGFHTEHIRQNYARPVSSFYERPESACYERPESACSDMRPSSKPPVVPPKTDKALRRAKRLTSRRVKKVEDDKEPSDTPVQPETKSQAVSSLPASPIIQMSTPQSVQASPVISHYHVEPNYVPPAPSLVAHSFPVTQRRLLQDPNSGQIFMVDMPVQVKTKTFFDPETGKYLQLNVRQRAQSTLSQPASVEVLGHPYVMYPGFLPMPFSVPSLPSVRSSSQVSAPASLTEEPNQLKASHESNEQEISEPEHHRNVVQHKRPVHRTREQTGRDILQTENARMTPRQTHIITMSELEDFAVENT